MKNAVTIFLAVWLAVTLHCIFKPAKAIQTFHTLSKILGIDPNEVTDRQAKFFQGVNIFILLFILFVFEKMLKGQLNF